MALLSKRVAERTTRLAVLLVVALAALGCATVTSDELIPNPITLPADSLKLGGSVSVNVMMNMERLRIAHPRHFMPFDALSDRHRIAVRAGVASNNVEFASLVRGNQYDLRFSNGSLSFMEHAFGRINSTPVPLTAALASQMMKDALEKSCINTGLFARITPAPADYALDVWVDRYDAAIPTLGIGKYVADVFSIWRLTRVGDGKVLACDFVTGHGAHAKPGLEPSKSVYNAAVRDMINNGIGVVCDQSEEHLSALVPAGMDRLSRGAALPAGSDRWRESVRQGWSKLHRGMTVKETEAVIGPVRIANASWDYEYVLPFHFGDEYIDYLRTGLEGVGEVDLLEYRTSLYSLIFISQRAWKYSPESGKSVLLDSPVPPWLLLWDLVE